jgi:hypothetical protein
MCARRPLEWSNPQLHHKFASPDLSGQDQAEFASRLHSTRSGSATGRQPDPDFLARLSLEHPAISDILEQNRNSQ